MARSVLRGSHIAVSFPVSPDLWARWRKRVLLAQGTAAVGGVLIGTGLAVGAAAPLAAGVPVFVGAIALWARQPELVDHLCAGSSEGGGRR